MSKCRLFQSIWDLGANGAVQYFLSVSVFCPHPLLLKPCLTPVSHWSSRDVLWMTKLHPTSHRHEGDHVMSDFLLWGWTHPLTHVESHQQQTLPAPLQSFRRPVNNLWTGVQYQNRTLNLAAGTLLSCLLLFWQHPSAPPALPACSPLGTRTQIKTLSTEISDIERVLLYPSLCSSSSSSRARINHSAKKQAGSCEDVRNSSVLSSLQWGLLAAWNLTEGLLQLLTFPYLWVTGCGLCGHVVRASYFLIWLKVWGGFVAHSSWDQAARGGVLMAADHRWFHPAALDRLIKSPTLLLDCRISSWEACSFTIFICMPMRLSVK